MFLFVFFTDNFRNTIKANRASNLCDIKDIFYLSRNKLCCYQEWIIDHCHKQILHKEVPGKKKKLFILEEYSITVQNCETLDGSNPKKYYIKKVK